MLLVWSYFGFEAGDNGKVIDRHFVALLVAV